MSHDGARAIDAGTNLYGQFFVIYAASRYYKAFNDTSALQAALETFHATDALFHDPVAGGYDETGSLPRLHDVRLPGGRMPRTLNIFLHGTGAGGVGGEGGRAARLQGPG